MTRARPLDAQWATVRASSRSSRRPVGEQITDHHLLVMPAAEFHVEAAERRKAALKVTDIAVSQHACELDPDRGATECTHPDHDRDAEWAKEALDWLGLPGEDLLTDDEPAPLEDYVPPFDVEQAQQKARLTRSTFTAPDWSWQEHAACKGEDLVTFFGEPGEAQKTRVFREARAAAICRSCPVVAECLESAFRHHEKAGVWGGTGEDDRVNLRRNWLRRRASAA